VRLGIRRLDPDIELPRRGNDGDAAFDLCARESVVLPPNGARATIPTGVSLSIPPGHVGLVLSRSGLAADHGVAVLNAPGIIDSGYRGEVQVILINHDPDAKYEINRGDRIAQLMIAEASSVEWVEAESLPSTPRGLGGLGSTGR
jgi:dUTP pyrophosphatase